MWRGTYDARDERSGTIRNAYGEVIVRGLTMEQTFALAQAHNKDLEAFQVAIYRAVHGVPIDPQKVVEVLTK